MVDLSALNPFGPPKPLRGVLAIYDNPDTLIHAAGKMREAGFTNADVLNQRVSVR